MENLPSPKEITVRPVNAETRVAGYPGYGAGYGEGYPAAPQQETEGGGLLAYWLSIRRHKGMVLLFATIGIIGGVLMTLRQTPIYQARTSIEVQDINLDFLGGRPVQPVGDDSNYAALSDIPTQVRLLQSESLRARVIDKLSANGAVTKTAPSFLATWKAALKIGPAQPASQTVDARSALMGCRVLSSTTTRIIDLLCDSSSPAFAADYANTLASEFIDTNVEARWKMSQRTGEWLAKQLEDLRIKLERSEDSLQNYAHRANLNFTAEKTNVSEERLSQIQGSLSEAQSARVDAQSRYEIIKSSPPDALGAIAGDESLRILEDKLSELRRTEADLLTTYTPKHEKVVRVQAQIAPLQASIQKQRAITLARAQKEYEGAENKERLLTTEYGKQSQVISGESERSIQYSILKREVDSNRQLYDAMLQKVKETSVTSAMRASNIRVVDPAKPPAAPYKPDLGQNLEIGAIAGLLLGVSFVLMRERADHTIQEPGDAPFWLGVPELGIIPKAKMGLSWRLSYGGGNRPSLASAAGANGGSDNRLSLRTEGKIVELVTWQSKPSVIAEAFRAVLVSILFANQEKKRPRVLVVTSSGPAEGKSTVVTNLGIAVAEVNQRVLLVDADLRKPRLHSILGVNNDKGLSDLLRSREPVAKAIEGLIQETGVPGLYLLPSGPSTSAAASLLYSNRMPEIIRALRAQFDTVFIDTPPMLQIPDARVVGRMVDRVVMVVRAGKTTRDAAMAARQRFAEDGTNVLGTILNDWNPKWSPSGYYGYDGGYYAGYYEHKNGYSRSPLSSHHEEAEVEETTRES